VNLRRLKKECRSYGIDFYSEDAPHQLVKARQFEQQRVERYAAVRGALKEFQEKNNIRTAQGT
jgi:hypothetical protein